jgi:predicted ester cyclase
MSIPPELAAGLTAYAHLWQPLATDAAVEALFAPDFVDHRPGADGAGLREFRDHRALALNALADLQVRYEPIAADGTRVAVHGTVSGTHTGEFFGIGPTGKRLSWREVHVFDFLNGRIVEHWMDAALLAVYLQMLGQSEADGEAARTVPSGLQHDYTPAEQLIPLTNYMQMVASGDASSARDCFTDDYLQHGPFGPNVGRDEFEASNREIVWRALPDISIRLEPLVADGELVAARGYGQATHTGTDLFGNAASGKRVTFSETHVFRMRGNQVCEHWLQVDLLGLLDQLRS